ncbi:MAG: TraB/GumN family protein, partial [Gammaproteobacteria bacterium]|nr:TraB/GumN family protein [Gammaproteobacteria bacterium]
SVIDLVYDDADELVMELDMDDVDAVTAMSAFSQLGVLRDDTTLKQLLGEELHRQAVAAAEATDIPLDLLNKSEPWLATVVVQELMADRIGFSAELGVEQYLTSKAIADGKPITGLETVIEQLSFLDRLSMDAQSQWLVHSLVDGLRIEMLADQLVEAWRNGDVDYLERELLHEAKMSPELHDALLIQRNRFWIDKIAGLLDRHENFLVVVGAAHLVGDGSVPDLLAERGVRVSQLGPKL